MPDAAIPHRALPGLISLSDGPRKRTFLYKKEAPIQGDGSAQEAQVPFRRQPAPECRKVP